MLDYSVQENSGVISGADGSRYTFAGSEWKGDVTPSRGMHVDFDVQGEKAVAVYRALGGSSGTGGKKKTTAGICAILVGGLGVHKFYHGSWGWGILYILFCWTYIPTILAVIEGIIYLTMEEEKYDDKYNGAKKAPFKW